MNERIKGLAEQAGSTHKLFLGVYQFYSDELEKFAELIVQDCVGIADEYDGVGSTIVSRIKQHFGVDK